MPILQLSRVFELDIFEGCDQSLNGLPLRQEAALFLREFVIDLLNDKL